MAASTSSVDSIYQQARVMAVNFDFKPEERINEGALATRLGTSRTPVREALNRLSAEGFLTFQTGRGFFNRALNPQEILDLYDARQAVECHAIRLAAERATDNDIKELQDYLDAATAAIDENTSTERLVECDEEFHMRLTALAGNAELNRMLANLNARIRYIRLIDMAKRRLVNNGQHSEIIAALAARDARRAADAMHHHIAKRSEQATEAVRVAYSQIYVPN